MWLKLCVLLDLEHLTTDPRFLTNADRMRNRHELKNLLEVRLKTRTRMEWTSLLIAQQIPAGPISNLEDVFMDAQVVATGLVETVEHPVLGALKRSGEHTSELQSLMRISYAVFCFKKTKPHKFTQARQ